MVAGVATGVGFALKAMNENIMFFFTPSEVVTGKAPNDRLFRMGGMVVAGSVHRPGEGLTVHFDLTDNEKVVTVQFAGILPDLFREGQGIVATGKMQGNMFLADQVLAKHDENYMPPEVAKALKESGRWQEGAGDTNGGGAGEAQ